MIKSLRKKFVMINMLLVFIVLFIVFASAAATNIRRAKSETFMALQMALGGRVVTSAARAFPINEVTSGRAQAFSQTATQITFYRTPSVLVVLDENGVMELFRADAMAVSIDIINEVVELVKDSPDDFGTVKKYNLQYLRRYEGGKTALGFVELSAEQNNIRHVIFASIVMGSISMACFFAVSLFLSKWALKPVEKAWEQQRRFVSDASHELKTPLTVILANMGILKTNNEDSVKNQIKWVENTQDEATRMKELVDNLLFLAKNDDADTKVIYDAVDFSDTVLTIALSMESVAYEKNIAIETDNIESGLKILGSNEQLKRLVMILLDNAVKYSDENSRIPIELRRESGKAILKISNNGSQLPPEKIPHIFDRFYRVDESRSKEGYGLGLSIAKSIVANHNGTITAESINDLTVLSVVLPLS